MHRQLEWDDLFYVLSVGRAGSLSGAARALSVNHSTIFRRIGRIEQHLNVRLFERHRDGYSPTTAGEALLAFAEKMDAGILELERQIVGEDLRPHGTVRLTTTETLIPIVLSILSRFKAEYPNIRVELTTGSQSLNLSRRDADIALRPTIKPEEHLVGRKLARIAFSIYGSDEYLKSAGSTDFRLSHQWVGFDDNMSHLLAFKWLSSNVTNDQISIVASSLNTALAAAKAGLGLAILPCYMAKQDSELINCSDTLADVSTDLWLLVHQDLRKTARVRALMDFLATDLSEMRIIFERAL